MSYETVLAGLHVRFATVTTPRAIAAILAYEPTAVQEYPLLYSLLDSFEVKEVRVDPGTAAMVTTIVWRTAHRLCLRWQDSEECEKELRAFADSILTAVNPYPFLGGALTSGNARITEGDTGWVTIGTTECRYLDFYSMVTEKRST